MIKVAIAGIRGKMGQTALEAITETPGMEVVAAYDYKHDGQFFVDGEVGAERSAAAVPMFSDLQELVEQTEPTLFFDVTRPNVVFSNVTKAIEQGLHIVVGTSGLTESSIAQIRSQAEAKKVSVVIAPNFSIGAVLMMKFSQMAARFLPDVEIIEMHHNNKVDAPSGTAVKTAQMIQEVRDPHTQGHPNETEELQGARGADIDGMKIHSVRLHGLLAHQQVLFGSAGELLTIRHDSFDRASFKQGIVLATQHASTSDDFVYGLEQLLKDE